MYVFNRLGIAFRKQKKYKQAVANYIKAIKINNQDENLYFNLGRCFLEMGEIEKAKKSMSQAVSINSGFTEARDLLSKM